jgi:hypothetical protein
MRAGITNALAALTVILMTGGGAVQALEGAKYPDWTGGWRRWAPPNAVRDSGNGGINVTAGGQPSFDQTKPWGLGQEAPLTPEYQTIFADSLADQANGGQGNFFRSRGSLYACGHADDDDRIFPAGIRHHTPNHLYSYW